MKTIKVYSTEKCKYCVEAKDYFKENNIPFTTVDVGTDTTERALMVAKSGQMGVPVIEVGEDMMVGWDEAKFKELYEADSTEKEEQEQD